MIDNFGWGFFSLRSFRSCLVFFRHFFVIDCEGGCVVKVITRAQTKLVGSSSRNDFPTDVDRLAVGDEADRISKYHTTIGTRMGNSSRREDESLLPDQQKDPRGQKTTNTAEQNRGHLNSHTQLLDLIFSTTVGRTTSVFSLHRTPLAPLFSPTNP